MLAHWERTAEAATIEDLALQRKVSQARPMREFGDMFTVGCDGSSGSEEEGEPYNIWNALLAALGALPHRAGAAAAAHSGGYGAWRCRATLHATCCAREL